MRRGETEATLPVDSYELALPVGFPKPWVPPDNPMSEAKVALGRALFFDERLSGNGTMACASCHERDRGLPTASPPRRARQGTRSRASAMGLANVAYFPLLTWGNPTLSSLEEQALVPMFGENPVELGITGAEDVVLGRLRNDEGYKARVRRGLPDERADHVRIPS